MVFYILLRILDWRSMPLKDNAPGPLYFANVNRQNLLASFRRHYLDFFALIPLKKLFVARRTDYQMACWHIRDTRKKSRTNLQGKHLPITWNYTGSHLTQMFFWHVFGSMGFLQLEEENSRTEKFQSRSIGNLRDKQGIRIGKSLVPGD